MARTLTWLRLKLQGEKKETYVRKKREGTSEMTRTLTWLRLKLQGKKKRDLC